MLTVKQIEALRSGDCPERVPDGNGLYLRVVKSGNRTFQTRTNVNGKLKWITLGSYPEMTLKEARVKSALAKAGVSESPSPANDLIDAFRPDQKVANPEEAPKFRQIADKWFEMKKEALSNGKHIHQNWRTLETYVLPYLGDVPITEIRRKDIIAIFNPIWRAKNETATRTLNRVKEVFELACALEIVEHNPAVFSTKAAFGRVKRIVKHHKALDWERVPEFYSWIQSHDCEEDLRQMILAMLFSAKRTREVRYVAWQDLQLDQGIWTSRAAHMKMRREHRIPVSQQLSIVFQNMAVFRGIDSDTVSAFRPREFVPVFTRPRNKSGVIDENRACREIQKFQSDITGHGLRSAFRTWARKKKCYAEDLMEQDWHTRKTAL